MESNQTPAFETNREKDLSSNDPIGVNGKKKFVLRLPSQLSCDIDSESCDENDENDPLGNFYSHLSGSFDCDDPLNGDSGVLYTQPESDDGFSRYEINEATEKSLNEGFSSAELKEATKESLKYSKGKGDSVDILFKKLSSNSTCKKMKGLEMNIHD